MRKSTLLWLGLTVFCGVALFHTSQQVHDGQELVAEMNSKIKQERESIEVLKAEWSYLNQPARLEKLARQHLGLTPMKGQQFKNVADLANLVSPPVIAETPKPTITNKNKVVIKKPSFPKAHLPTPATEDEQQDDAPEKKSTASRGIGDVLKNLGLNP